MWLSESGDIPIYGCDVAAGPEGQALITVIATATQADVAASTDLEPPKPAFDWLPC